MTKMVVPILVDEGFNWSVDKSCTKCIFYKDGISCAMDYVKNEQEKPSWKNYLGAAVFHCFGY